MTYELTVPNTKHNRDIVRSLLDNFVSIDVEYGFDPLLVIGTIKLMTESIATWNVIVAAFEETQEVKS